MLIVLVNLGCEWQRVALWEVENREWSKILYSGCVVGHRCLYLNREPAQ